MTDSEVLASHFTPILPTSVSSAPIQPLLTRNSIYQYLEKNIDPIENCIFLSRCSFWSPRPVSRWGKLWVWLALPNYANPALFAFFWCCSTYVSVTSVHFGRQGPSQDGESCESGSLCQTTPLRHWLLALYVARLMPLSLYDRTNYPALQRYPYQVVVELEWMASGRIPPRLVFVQRHSVWSVARS